MANCAYLKDGPKAGEFVPIDDDASVLQFVVYSSIAHVLSSFDCPLPPMRLDEYRHLGTVELYEYVGRR